MKERTGINDCDNKRGKRYVVFDVETTGLFVEQGHRIIEIGAVAVNGGVMGEEFSSLIFTDKPITKKAQKVHGITTDMLAGQPKPEEALAAFRYFIGSSTLVAHNAVFDVWFLRYEYWRLGHTLINPHKCTLKMSRKLYPGLPNYRLETVARHLGILVNMQGRHRALDDARLTAQVWMEMRRK
ncbi:MAG: 3'-5' exonuclease [Proteobacteria bacterium]|nr:3'-5' exonuclease [Pseudomonadota bacterium]